MNLLRRPIENIRNINLELIAFVSFWCIIFLLWVIPVGMYSDIKTALSLLFSFDLLDKVEVVKDSTSIDSYSSTVLEDKKNSIITIFNVTKVALWVALPISTLYFLFKRPKNADFENTNSSSTTES